MTVRLETKINRYIGLSGDEKPRVGLMLPADENNPNGIEILPAGLPNGSTFLEADTGIIWHWNGSEWRAGTTPQVLELLAIKSLLATLVEQGADKF